MSRFWLLIVVLALLYICSGGKMLKESFAPYGAYPAWHNYEGWLNPFYYPHYPFYPPYFFPHYYPYRVRGYHPGYGYRFGKWRGGRRHRVIGRGAGRKMGGRWRTGKHTRLGVRQR